MFPFLHYLLAVSMLALRVVTAKELIALSGSKSLNEMELILTRYYDSQETQVPNVENQVLTPNIPCIP